jgi:phenylalanyl-tRNA synthetase beta chain
MPDATFDKAYLMSLIGKNISQKEFGEHIAKLGIELKHDYEHEISFEITPNRLDLIDPVGFARTFNNFMHKSKKFLYTIAGASWPVSVKVGHNVLKTRPFIAIFTVTELNFNETSLKHMLLFVDKLCDVYGRQRRKVAVGIYDLRSIKGKNLIYDASSDEEFIPLGNTTKMKFSMIIAETEKGIKYASAIKRRYAFPTLKDDYGTVALIPITNADRTKVTSLTKEILIDVSGTSQIAVEKVADMLACMFMDMGGVVGKGTVEYPKGPLEYPVMNVREILIPLSRIESQIGVVIGYTNVISLANKMGYEAALLGRKIMFKVPQYRLDVISSQDIVEDLAIGYGYDYIRPVPVYSASEGQTSPLTKKICQISDIMIGLGFNEMMNSYLTNEGENFSKTGIVEGEYIKLKNSKSILITMLRTHLLPSLLGNLSKSAQEAMPQKVFELDLAFEMKDGKVYESHKLAAVMADPKADINHIKAVIKTIAATMGMNYAVEEAAHGSFIEGRSGIIIVDGRKIGLFGEVHPKVLSNFGIEEPCIAFEMYVE